MAKSYLLLPPLTKFSSKASIPRNIVMWGNERIYVAYEEACEKNEENSNSF